MSHPLISEQFSRKTAFFPEYSHLRPNNFAGWQYSPQHPGRPALEIRKHEVKFTHLDDADCPNAKKHTGFVEETVYAHDVPSVNERWSARPGSKAEARLYLSSTPA
jgi:hypothetical protein